MFGQNSTYSKQSNFLLKGKQFFLRLCCFWAKNYLILHPSLENLTTNIASKRSRNPNRICKFRILGSMPSDEWFRLVDIALDKFSLKIVNHKSRLQFCTIKAGKAFFCGCLLRYVCQNGPWSFTFLADIFESKVHI